jgi:pimeloyl-ACP methyl ester carboxylesterase
MDILEIPSHGVSLNGFVYVAAGRGPHPIVVLFHGLPGYERNLDIAQDIRRAGWDVLYFDYRGSWGSPGSFSLAHCIEDAEAVISYLRQPAVALRLREDASRIVLLGHSMGGFVAVQAAAADPAIHSVALISAVDVAGFVPEPLPNPDDKLTDAMAKGYASEGLAPLAGCSAQELARETVAHARQWRFQSQESALHSRRLLIVTSDDGFAQGGNALAAAVGAAGNRNIVTMHFSTDHSYSYARIDLSYAILRWLLALPAPDGGPNSASQTGG